MKACAFVPWAKMPNCGHPDRAPDPIHQAPRDPPADAGELVEQRVELPMVEHEELGLPVGEHRGGPWPAVDQRYLPEELARPEPGDAPALALHDHVAPNDDEELVAHRPLADEDVAVRGAHPRGKVDQPTEVRPIETLEQRDASQERLDAVSRVEITSATASRV